MTPNTSTTLRHDVLFAFKDSATVEQIDAVVADFGRLKERIPGCCTRRSLFVDYWAQ
jgi:hypothetical protein